MATCPHCRATLTGANAPPTCPLCARPIVSKASPIAWLAITPPEAPPSEFRLGDKARIGRHPANTLRVAARELSKEHAEIVRQSGDYWLVDLNSSNGTFVNGRRVTRFKLKDGDEISLGGTAIVFHTGVPTAKVPAPAVTMVQEFAPQVLASVRAEPTIGFRPECEIDDHTDLRRDYEKLRIANEFHRQVGLERNLATLYEKILEVAFDLLSAETGVILLFNPATGQLTPEAVRKRKEGEAELSQTLLDQVVQSREGLLTQAAIVDARFSASASIVAQGIRSAMAVPLLSKGELQGVLYIDTRQRAGAFTEKDLRILTGVAAQAAVAIENAELARRIEQEAETRAHLSRFLSPHMVEQAQKGQLDLQKGGQLCEVTVLFADIRGFTTMTERAPPQEIVALLNEYFELMVDEVFANGGVLDKFIGACIMAIWGAPVVRKDDAARAVRAAVGRQTRLFDFNLQRKAAGKLPVSMGVGINTGLAVVGNMGSSKRLEYTAIGDSVNLASRLCGVAREGQIVISSATVKGIGDEFELLDMPPTKVKGKQEPVSIFQVLGFADEETSAISK